MRWWFLVGVTLLFPKCGQPHPQPEEQDNNIRRSGGDNRIIRRERPTSAPLNNLTTIVNFVGNNCQQYCGDQTQYNNVCKVQGCSSWRSALREGCFTTCTGVESSYRENYACQVGCSRAVEDYYLRLTNGPLTPGEPPTLLSGSLKSTSLKLSWEGPSSLPFISYSVQRKRSGALWETQQTPINSTALTILNLKPYTQYQFRVGWILASDFAPFYSRESNPILTLPKGLPTAPEITSIQPISNTSVAITWSPPTQPNGRLVAYILKLQQTSSSSPQVIKEIPISHNPRGYTFSALLPFTNYSLALSAQNLEGEGDSTDVHFVTPQSLLSNEVSKSPEPRLLIQGVHEVYTQPLDLLVEPDFPKVFTLSSHNITGVAAHIKQNFIFLSTSSGQILRVSTTNNSSLQLISKERLELQVSHLSVDWLHNKLYIVGKKNLSSKWVIKRCNLDGFSLTTIYTELSTRPLHFAADPFTGYLYWVLPPSQWSRGGLFKLDLVAEHFHGGPVAQIVREDNELGPFTLDVANYRILVVHKGRNTVLSVSLDGDVSDIRSNTQSPQFNEAVSLSFYNGVLFWTTPTSVVTEEYNSAADSYFQNSFDVPKSLQPLGVMLMKHPDSQPLPVPMAPPQQLQVLYGQTRARITWRPPPPISALGNVILDTVVELNLILPRAYYHFPLQ